MILPTNGKVVVFDDQQKDIESLLRALSKEKIPFLYYQDENGSDLPDTPIENIRLIFLDLELVTNNPSSHNIISTIAGRLRRVLVRNNPYILIYWSTKEDKYRTDLEKAFDDGLKEYKPIKIVSLNKAEALASDNPAQFVTEKLGLEMNSLSSLIAFMLWESSANEAAGKITNELTSFINREKFDASLYGLLHKLAMAQAGPDAYEEQDNNSRLNLAFEVINNSLVETTERAFVERLPQLKISDIKAGGSEFQPREKVVINTKLHVLVNDSLQHFYTGNLYIHACNAMAREIISRSFKPEIISKFNESDVKLVCLDITPACDYAQKKHYTRLVYGAKIDPSFKTSIKLGDYKYKSFPVLDIEGESVLIFDYRTIRSFSKEEFIYKYKDKPRYRLRNSILLDIQAQLANHINRPGIVSIP